MTEHITMLAFPSQPQSVARVETMVEQLANKLRIAPDTYGNILVSLTEAVNNAIIHGNGRDESKSVRVELLERRGKIAFRVSDEGKGFDYNNLPDPTCSENLCKCGGRGVFLMRELSDNITFRNNGSTVEMQFRI